MFMRTREVGCVMGVNNKKFSLKLPHKIRIAPIRLGCVYIYISGINTEVSRSCSANSRDSLYHENGIAIKCLKETHSCMRDNTIEGAKSLEPQHHGDKARTGR